MGAALWKRSLFLSAVVVGLLFLFFWTDAKSQSYHRKGWIECLTDSYQKRTEELKKRTPVAPNVIALQTDGVVTTEFRGCYYFG
jgi:hypothetical protein